MKMPATGQHHQPSDSGNLRFAELEARVARLCTENIALREALTLRDQALDGTPTFFVITKLVKPEPLIVYCNKVVADQHGFRREDLIGLPISVLAQWLNRAPSQLRDVEDSLRAGQVIHYEDEVTRRDGTTFWLGVSIRPLYDEGGRLTHSVAVGADITAKRERVRMATELQLAQKLESVGRLAAGIAHEINTPIQYVGDSVYFLRSAYEDFNRLLGDWQDAIDALPDSPSRTALSGQIRDASNKFDLPYHREEIPKAFDRTFDGVQRVTNIVNAMKEFAHPDAKEQSAADLNHAIASTLLVASNEYKYLAKIEARYGELPQVMCNVGELNQVFLNLIVNAAHAIQDAGRDLNTGTIRITTTRAGDCVEVRVSDNGCGVPTENLAKLYDPFFTTKEVGRGTGQGLTIAHSIVVDKHGGQIGVDSSVGRGTEFTLRLPIAGRDARVAS
jgi:PAS domain S-box-containing protein